MWFRGTYSYLSACFVSHLFPAPMVRRSKKSRALRKKPRILIGIFLLGLVSTALIVSRSDKEERCEQHQLWFRGTYSYLSACFVSHLFPAPMVRRSKKSRALRKKPRILIGIFLLGLVSTALMVSRSDKVERCEQHRVWFRGTLRIL